MAGGRHFDHALYKKELERIFFSASLVSDVYHRLVWLLIATHRV